MCGIERVVQVLEVLAIRADELIGNNILRSSSRLLSVHRHRHSRPAATLRMPSCVDTVPLFPEATIPPRLRSQRLQYDFDTFILHASARIRLGPHPSTYSTFSPLVFWTLLVHHGDGDPVTIMNPCMRS